jgi:hypothetical protein
MTTVHPYFVAAVAILATTFFSEDRRVALAGSEERVINADGNTYDSHPSMSLAEDGTAWIAWHAYRDSTDRVLARRIDAAGDLGPIHAVSGQGSVHGPPSVVQTAPQLTWVIWPAKVGPRWQILARNTTAGRWSDIVVVSESATDAIYPTAAPLADGRMLVAWSQYNRGNLWIWGRVFAHGEWQEPLTEYEYALGNFLANTYTREHRFVSLPGYEWTGAS